MIQCMLNRIWGNFHLKSLTAEERSDPGSTCGISKGPLFCPQETSQTRSDFLHCCDAPSREQNDVSKDDKHKLESAYLDQPGSLNHLTESQPVSILIISWLRLISRSE